MSFEIDISCQPNLPAIDRDRLHQAIIHGLKIERVESAVLSVTIVDNATIHRLNNSHLQHDYPTDVISFQLESTPPPHEVSDQTLRSNGAGIEGEIVISAEYAAEEAPKCGWTTQDELTLYAIHGMLHICGYDDLDPAERRIMRARERAVLEGLGLVPKFSSNEDDDDSELSNGDSPGVPQ